MATRNYVSSSQRYMTPPSLYQPILDFMGIDEFDLDVACENKNIPAKMYYTKEGLYTKDNFFFQVSPHDGLSGSWSDYVKIIFMNCPWDLSRKFIHKAVQEVNANPDMCVWAILPSSRPECIYMRENILMNPNCFITYLPLQGFLVPEKPLEAPVPSVKAMVVYFGQDAWETAKSWQEMNSLSKDVVYNAMTVRNELLDKDAEIARLRLTIERLKKEAEF